MDSSVFTVFALYAILLEALQCGGGGGDGSSGRALVVSAADATSNDVKGAAASVEVVDLPAPVGGRQDYWKELEAEMYLVEFLNLTKTLLTDREKPTGTELPAESRVPKCVEFGESLGQSQLAMSLLIEATNSARLYEAQLGLEQKNNKKNSGEKVAPDSDFLTELVSQFHKESLFDRQRLTLEIFETLSTMASLYYDCLVGAKLRNLGQLHDRLLEVNDHMQRLSEIVDHVSLGQQMSFVPFLRPASEPLEQTAPANYADALKSTLTGWRQRAADFFTGRNRSSSDDNSKELEINK